MRSQDRTARQLAGICAVAALASLSLSGCSSIGSALGITKNAPDEFAVVTKAPLVIPPDYSLRPPQPGATRPQEMRPGEQARSLIFASQSEVETSPAASPSEALLLQETGANHANPDIRRILTEETTALLEKEHTFADRILFWKGEAEEPTEVVDAGAEAQRIREHRAKGESVTGADTPTIAKGGGGIFSF
ncbi:MAG: DUF3035 domain-containing protein [Alphaproteobacteria bacterium]|nr:DUF3035 domain-containing protein [Alphaproteobacteria bacterium]